MSSKLVGSLAKVYDPKASLKKGNPGKMAGDADDQHAHGFNIIHVKMESLSEKMDKLIHLQGKVLNRLDGMSEEIEDIEQDMETLMVDKEEVHVLPALPRLLEPAGTNQVKEMCKEMTTIMSAVNKRSEQQEKKLEGMEKLVLSIQEVISFIGETVKGSQLMELLFKRGSTSPGEGVASPPPKENTNDKGKQTIKRQASTDKGESVLSEKLDKLKDQKGREGKEKPGLSLKLQKKPPDLSDTSSLKKHPLQQKDIQKLNQQNAERSSCMQTTGSQNLETGGEVPQVTLESQGGLDRLNAILDHPKAPAAKQREDSKIEGSRVKLEVLSKFETKKEEEVESPKMGKGKEAKEKVKEAAVTPADSVGPSICKTPKTQKPFPADASVKPTDKPGNVDPMLQRKDESKSVATRKDESKSVATRKDESKSVATRKDESKSVATRKDESKSVATRKDESKSVATRKDESKSVPTRKDESKSVPNRKDQSKSTPSSLVEAKPDHGSKVASSSQTQVPEKVPEPQECNESRHPEEVKEEGVDEGGKEAMEEGEMGRQTAGGETAVAEPQEGAEDAGDSEQRAANLEEFKRLWLQKKEELEGLQGRQEEAETKFMIDVSHPPIAPFSHRIVATKPNQINNFYTINKEEMLGGGRFGQVHKCVENSSGLTLAAKIIKARSPKEKDTVKNEIQVMNQLDHATLIQLYAAYESIYDVILVLEYVDGGELFDRIIDENYKLTELDTVHFIRQICEGVQHMHKMSIVHLDLKPENIMCVSRVTNKIKIIDFGLARMYKPREKLKVSFGTPEFLAPEVVNYEFVSFRTDMWSLGVITYMLLSSLSPFLGDDDNETLNNILSCQWTFEEDEFTEISEEAKDFISKLLVLNKSWRMNSSEALEHDWLSNPGLHYRLHRKKNKCRSRRASCIPFAD